MYGGVGRNGETLELEYGGVTWVTTKTYHTNPFLLLSNESLQLVSIAGGISVSVFIQRTQNEL